MKLSNFEITKTLGSGPLDWQYFGEVDVAEWRWFRIVTTRRKVFREYCLSWKYLDTGEYVFGRIENLEAAWRARKKLEAA